MWLDPKNPIKIILPKDRGNSITVLGAISTKLDKLVYTLDSTTDNESVVKFMDELAKHIKPGATIVLDNHPSHHSVEVRKRIASMEANALYLPLYTSELNPIERVWAMFKRRWADKIVEEKGAIDNERAQKHIRDILENQISPESITNLAKNDIEYMITIMKETPETNEFEDYEV